MLTDMEKPLNRWQAFGIHLAISIVLLSLLMAVILLVWYPGLLFSVDGGWAGLRIVVGVDLVLGPLMTLVVYKHGKPGLKFDLSCIAVFQLGCMAAGMWVVYDERPLALIFAHDTFYSITSDEFEDFEKDPAVLDTIPGPWPKLIYTEMPENDIRADIMAIRGNFIGDPLYMQTDLYRPIPDTDTASIFRRESRTRAAVSEELRSQLPEGCLFSRFASSLTIGFVCFDAAEMKLESFYDNEINPGPAEPEEESTQATE